VHARTDNQDVIEVIEQLPDNVPMDEIVYRLYVGNKVRREMRDVEAGRAISSEELAREIRRKADTLADPPRVGRKVAELNDPQLREIAATPGALSTTCARTTYSSSPSSEAPPARCRRRTDDAAHPSSCQQISRCRATC
jgi:hypothetical protein